jgi:hypothetical protein
MTDTQPLTITPEVLAQLQAPTPQSARKQRAGSKRHDGECGRPCRQPHMMLTYVDARYVMAVLDSELGPANWQAEHSIGPGGKVGCRIGIRVDFGDGPEWVWKSDGAGETDIEGEKGSFSDAFKRAAVHWGIARDLYDEAPTTNASQVEPVAPAATAVQSAPQAIPQPAAADDGGVCPDHGTPWTLQPGGVSKHTQKEYDPFWKCGAKTNGAYCKQKPSKAWAARHETAA